MCLIYQRTIILDISDDLVQSRSHVLFQEKRTLSAIFLVSEFIIQSMTMKLEQYLQNQVCFQQK